MNGVIRIFKVAYRIQMWKKTFYQNSNKFCCSFIKNDIMFMYLPYIYKKPIILSLFKIDALNFTVYFSEFDMPLKPRLHWFIYELLIYYQLIKWNINGLIYVLKPKFTNSR